MKPEAKEVSPRKVLAEVAADLYLLMAFSISVFRT